MDGKRILKVITILVVAILCITFINYKDNKPGTAEEILQTNIGWGGYESFSKVRDIIEINDDGDALCVFETDSSIAIAYLNCVKNSKYKYGTAVEYPEILSCSDKYDICQIKAGDSDLMIKYVIVPSDVSVKGSVQEYKYKFENSSVSLHILSIEDYKCSGYEYHLLIRN